MFHIHKSEDGQFYFTLVARNGRQIMRSGDGYKRKAGALKAIDAVIAIGVVANHNKGGKSFIVDHTE